MAMLNASHQTATLFVFQPKTRLLSAASAPELLYWINGILETGAKNLLIDLRQVLFMDSSGLGTLVIANTRAQKAGSKLALCCLGGQARMLFETSGMEGVFDVYATVNDFEKTLHEEGSEDAIARELQEAGMKTEG